MKRILVIFVSVSIMLLIAGGCKDSSNPYSSHTSTPSPTGGTPSSTTIIIKSFAFSPVGDTISHGTTLTWKNNDGVAHTSTSDSGVWDTGTIPPGGSKTNVFNTIGTFPYHCQIHPSMTGTIVVR